MPFAVNSKQVSAPTVQARPRGIKKPRSLVHSGQLGQEKAKHSRVSERGFERAVFRIKFALKDVQKLTPPPRSFGWGHLPVDDRVGMLLMRGPKRGAVAAPVACNVDCLGTDSAANAVP